MLRTEDYVQSKNCLFFKYFYKPRNCRYLCRNNSFSYMLFMQTLNYSNAYFQYNDVKPLSLYLPFLFSS